MKIKCSTLFDITKTNISSRRQLLESNNKELEKQRNQQSNFETILQIISMRSQPEDITDPVMEIVSGSKFLLKKNKVSSWSFTFTVNHNSVFNDGYTELGNLFADCNGVPMIIGLNEQNLSSNTLISTEMEKNIFFEVIND